MHGVAPELKSFGFGLLAETSVECDVSEDKPGRNDLFRCLQICGLFCLRRMHPGPYLPGSTLTCSLQAWTSGWCS